METKDELLDKYKSIIWKFYMLHTELPVTINFKNGITWYGIDEGEERGRRFYKDLIKQTEEIFFQNNGGEKHKNGKNRTII